MKRSFFIKQLKSLKNQVESLLEAEGDAVEAPSMMANVTHFASAVKGAAEDSTLGKYVTKDPGMISFRKGASVVYNVATAPDGAAFFGDSIKYDWAKFKMGVSNTVEGIDKVLEGSAAYKSLKGYANRIKKGLDSTYAQIQAGSPDFWKNAALWQKFAILLAIFALLVLVVYAVTSDIGGSAKKIYDAFINAVKNASSRVAEAASKIEASVEGLKVAANVLIKAFVAPFEVLFDTLKATASADVAITFSVFAVALGSACAILYHRGKPQEPKAS
jgi:hypothetical protein